LRTGFWYCCVGIATTISPLLNYCLGRIQGSLLGWQYMFIILGVATCCWSFVLWFCLPNSPFTTKGLNEQERKIAIRRLERNAAGTITTIFNRKQFIEAFCDYKMYSCALIVLLTGVPSGAIGTFGTIVINGFGFSHFDSLALTSPIGAITALSIFLVSYITLKRKNMRYMFIIVTACISLTGTAICFWGPRSKRGVMFAGIFLLAVQVSAGGLAVSIASSNIAGHTKKSTVSATTFVGYCKPP
jgi:MFS family permease